MYFGTLPRSFCVLQHPETAGLHGWHWEIAVAYCDMLAAICIHGSTSTVRKMALVGDHEDMSQFHPHEAQPAVPMRSAGLIDLAHFKALHVSNDDGENGHTSAQNPPPPFLGQKAGCGILKLEKAGVFGWK